MLVKPYSRRFLLGCVAQPWSEDQGSPWRCETNDGPLLHPNGCGWSGLAFHFRLKWAFTVST